MDQSVIDFATKVISASDTDAVWQVTDQFFGDVGFSGIVYGVQDTEKAVLVGDTRFSDGLSDWRSAYFAEGDNLCDPLFVHRQLFPAQFLIGIAYIEKYPFMSERDCDVVYRADSFGYHSGLAISMHGRKPGATAGWILVSDLCQSRFTAHMAEVGNLLQIATTLAHCELEDRNDKEPDPDIQLTPRETECLLWLAKGLRTEAIADRLGIRPVTVTLHLSNARKRLGARTREQALAIALQSKLIAV